VKSGEYSTIVCEIAESFDGMGKILYDYSLNICPFCQCQCILIGMVGYNLGSN
jgi:hypothetical protein